MRPNELATAHVSPQTATRNDAIGLLHAVVADIRLAPVIGSALGQTLITASPKVNAPTRAKPSFSG
jgi:hypothetical protein